MYSPSTIGCPSIRMNSTSGYNSATVPAVSSNVNPVKTTTSLPDIIKLSTELTKVGKALSLGVTYCASTFSCSSANSDTPFQVISLNDLSSIPARSETIPIFTVDWSCFSPLHPVNNETATAIKVVSFFMCTFPLL